MFEKITAARTELQRIHRFDPGFPALDALFGAFQEALEGLEDRILELQGITAALTEKVVTQDVPKD